MTLPADFLALLGQTGVSDVVDVVRYGVGDVPVHGVTTAAAVFFLGVDADIGDFKVHVLRPPLTAVASRSSAFP